MNVNSIFCLEVEMNLISWFPTTDFNPCLQSAGIKVYILCGRDEWETRLQVNDRGYQQVYGYGQIRRPFPEGVYVHRDISFTFTFSSNAHNMLYFFSQSKGIKWNIMWM